MVFLQEILMLPDFKYLAKMLQKIQTYQMA